MIKKSTKTRKKATNSVAKKRKISSPVKKRATKRQNPFKNADYIARQGDNYKVQKVVATKNGLSIQEKVVKRNATTDKQLKAIISKK